MENKIKEQSFAPAVKKLLSLLLAIAMLFSITAGIDLSAYADELTTGKCGDNVIYSFDSSTGALTISGTGDMYNYQMINVDASTSIFSNSTLIKKVVIKNGVTSIGDYAFFSCDLTNIIIPDSVTSIGEAAFRFCKNLTNVTIPNSVTSIGELAFLSCNLTNIIIPDSVTSIGESAFLDCSNLTSITIGNNVTSIGTSAFYGTAYYNNKSNWTDGVLYIENYLIEADYDVTGEYTIKNGTTLIADGAFYACKSLTSISVDSNDKNYSSVNGVLYNKNKTELIKYPANKTDSSFVIPNGVTGIGKYAFDNCSSLTSVTIPNSVSDIGSHAFFDCENLSSITIPNGVTSINESTFRLCLNLKSITIPNSVKSIGKDAFDRCYNLTSVTIPNSVTKIDNGAFALSGLTSIIIPDGVTSIGKDAFFNCFDLTSVTIANSVSKIDKGAFVDCDNLIRVTIYSKNAKIENYAIPEKATIYGYRNSTVEEYAEMNGNKFVALDAETKLSTPTLKVTVNANGSFTLSWNKVTGATKYDLYLKNDDGSFKLMKSTTGTSFTTAVAAYGKQYTYKMKAVSNNESSDFSKTVTVVNNKTLSTPTLKTAVNANGSFTLSWNKVAGATRYGIYMLENGNYKWIKSTSATSWTTGVAQYGKKYTYKVFAVNDNTSAKSEFSSAVSATNNKKLQIPTAKVTVNANGSFTLSWGKVTGATRYGIYMLENGKYKWIKSTSATSWTTGTAQYGKKYTYKVFAVNDNTSAKSEFSSAFSATNNKKLQTPTLKVAVNKNGSFKLSWGKVTGATSYQIYMKQANGSYKLIKTTSATSFTTAVAAKGKTYSYKVRAVTSKNSSATSNYSNVVSATRK